MKISVREKISITGKANNQKVVFELPGFPALYMEPSAAGNGTWFTRFGTGHLRYMMDNWLTEEFGTLKPPFDEVVERVKALNPAPPNPKAMTWLK